jgi:hypothetical protein
MKRVYNNMLDRESLPRDAEGCRIYNNKLHLTQQLNKLSRTRLAKWIRVNGKQYKWECVLATLNHFQVAEKCERKVHFTDLMPDLRGKLPHETIKSSDCAEMKRIHFTDLM